MKSDRLIIIIGWAGLLTFGLLTILVLIYFLIFSNREYKKKKAEHEAQRKLVKEKIRSQEKSLSRNSAP